MKSLLLIITLFNFGCGAWHSDMASYTHINAYYLDPHLHSSRSSDFKFSHQNNPLPLISQIDEYAQKNEIDQVWLTDHIEDNPEPFESTNRVKDAIEICNAGRLCSNELEYKNKHFTLITAPYEGFEDTPSEELQGIELITTGGGEEPYEERTGLDYAIENIQQGRKLGFFGSSNSHTGHAGANGITAVDKHYGESLEDAVLNRHTTAVREKRHTIFLRLYHNNGLLEFPSSISSGKIDFKVYIVYRGYWVTWLLESDGYTYVDPSALATFVAMYEDGKLVAVTSPIYRGDKEIF